MNRVIQQVKSALLLLALPLAAQPPGEAISAAKLEAIGKQLAQEFRSRSLPFDLPAATVYAETIANRLREKLPPEESERLRFEVRHSRDRSDPVVLPGGHIFIPARMFLSVSSTDEFAGALAHAIAHAVLRHGIRQASRGAVGVSTIPVIFTTAHPDAESRQLIPLAMLPIQREQELEADAYAVALTAKAGFDSRAFASFVERTQQPHGKAERLSRLQELSANLPAVAPQEPGNFDTVRDLVRDKLNAQPKPPSLRRN